MIGFSLYRNELNASFWVHPFMKQTRCLLTNELFQPLNTLLWTRVGLRFCYSTNQPDIVNGLQMADFSSGYHTLLYHSYRHNYISITAKSNFSFVKRCQTVWFFSEVSLINRSSKPILIVPCVAQYFHEC